MLYEVEPISHTNAAFAAIRRGGAVVTWGKAKDGGDSSAVANYLIDIKFIAANAVAFAAVSSRGMLRATWGVSDAGGTVGGTSKVRYLAITPRAARARHHAHTMHTLCTHHAHTMHMLDHACPPCNPTRAQAVLLEKPIKEIKGALYAFAALLEDGTVQAWGWDGGGGAIPAAIQESLYNLERKGNDVQDGFDTIVEITASHSAFAARTTLGKVIAWGDAEAGGDTSGDTATRLANCNVKSIAATHYAFAALCEDGSIVPWGDEVSGGSYQKALDALGGASVAMLVGNNQAFAAITVGGGTVVAWGMERYGGDKNAVGDRLAEIAPIANVVAAEYAFAAVSSKGKVVAWGDPASGGDSAFVSDQLDGGVKEVVATEAAFAALKDDGSVVTWGDHNAGGSSRLVSNVLDRRGVNKIVASGSSFTALRTIF